MTQKCALARLLFPDHVAVPEVGAGRVVRVLDMRARIPRENELAYDPALAEERRKAAYQRKLERQRIHNRAYRERRAQTKGAT